jgi:hypothetical protein
MTDPSGYAKKLALPAGFDAPPPARIRTLPATLLLRADSRARLLRLRER